MMALDNLRLPFVADDIEWRIGQCGKKGEKIWAKALAYVTNRAIMNRLDDVCGPSNWQNEYRAGPSGGVICGISIFTANGWVTKWDGAENTDIEEVKGGLSNAMKRAAVQWGIGRYLYDLPEGWAKVHANGKHSARLKKEDGGEWFKWDAPDLPKWATAAPEGYEHTRDGMVDIKSGAVVESPDEKVATGHDINRLRSVMIDLGVPELVAKMTKEEKAEARKADRLVQKTGALERDVLTAYSAMVNLLARLKHPTDIAAQMALIQDLELEAA